MFLEMHLEAGMPSSALPTGVPVRVSFRNWYFASEKHGAIPAAAMAFPANFSDQATAHGMPLIFPV
jgi:hypothetical protein